MKINIEDFRRMAVFVEVVEVGGFTPAARQLGLSKSTVSKLVGQLEEAHGVQLLHRTTRSLRPTEAGLRFYRDCAAAVRAADVAVAALEGVAEQPHGTLRVAAPIGIGEELVAPALADFLGDHPQLGVELTFADDIVDLLAEDIDMAVRGGLQPDSSLITRKLAPLTLQVCASPRYLARHPRPRCPAELHDHTWIRYSPLGNPQRLHFRYQQQRETVRLHGRIAANNAVAVAAFIGRGFGLGVLPDFFAAAAIASGELRTVLDDYPLEMGSIYAVYPPSKYVPPRVRGFIDFLVTRLQSPQTSILAKFPAQGGTQKTAGS